DPVNQIADNSPGFVWRLKTEAGDATSVQIFDDPLIVVNFSIWESLERLREFVYRSGHLQRLRRRAERFERTSEAHIALWWITAGHIPSVKDARERLKFLQQHGDTPVAFSFAKPFAPPDYPVGIAAPSAISYDGRRFAIHINSSSGDCIA